MKRLLLIFLLLISQLSFSQTADEYYKMAQKETEFKNLKLEFLNQALVANPKHFLARFERAAILAPIDSLKAVTDINILIKQNPKVDSLLAIRAAFYVQLKNYSLAINDLSLYLSKHPNSFIQLCNRGGCYTILGQYTKANQDLDKAFLLANSNFDKAYFYKLKGDVSFAKKDTTESITYWEKSIMFIENVELLEKTGVILLTQGKYQLALQKINRLLELRPNESRLWMSKAQIESLDQFSDYSSAVQSIHKALEIEPHCIGCLEMLKNIQTLTNQDNEAIQTMEKIAILNPDSADVIKGEILNLKIKLKRYDEVFNDIDLAIKKDNKNKEIYLFNRVKIKRNIGKPQDALSDIEILIQDHPKNRDYQILKNTFLIEVNRFDDAIEDCNKQLMSRPNDFLIYGNRGMTHGKLKKWKKANDDINKAIQLAKIQKADNPILAELFGLKFEIKINQKDTLEALSALNEAIALSPEIRFLKIRGELNFFQKNYNKAIQDLKKIIEQSPNDFGIINALCNIHIENNEKKAAFDLVSEAIQRNSKDGNFYLLRASINVDYIFDKQLALHDIEKAISLKNCIDTVGLYRINGIALRQLGKFKEAITSLSKAIELESLNANLYNHRGLCYNNMLDGENSATNDYKKAIAINPKFAWAYLNLGRINLNKAKSLEEKQEAILLIDKCLSLTVSENPVSATRIEALLVKSKYFVEKDIALSVKLAKQAEELLLNNVDSNSWLYSELYTLKARLAIQQDKKNIAKDWTLKAIQCKNFNYDTKRTAFFILALLAEEEDKINEACIYADSILKMSSETSQLFKDEVALYKGSVLGKRMEFDKAKKVIEGITLNKYNKCLWYLVQGAISLKERTYQKAITYFNSSIEAFDTYVPVIFNLDKDNIYVRRGDAYLKYQFYEDARADYDKALKINPKNKEAIAGKKKAQDGIDGKLSQSDSSPTENSTIFPPYPKRVALVVGNSNYAYATKLDKMPINDANDISKRLKELGFEVITVIDATLSAMNSAVDSWREKIKDADIALFFYGGHGLEDDDKENYLIPIDAKIEAPTDISIRCYPMNQIVRQLDRNNPIFGVLILDACRNNPFKGSKNRTIGDNNTRAFRGVEVAPNGKSNVTTNRFVAMATAPATVAEQGERNGIYTSFLLKHLQKGTRLEDVFQKVRQDVSDKTNQKQIPEQNMSMSKSFSF